MARRIYARFEDRPDGHIEVLVSKGGVDRIVPLEDAGLKASDDVVVFVPGIDVASHNASVPARREREARKAAAFSIEDDVAEPVEALHVALSPKGDDDQRTILVCSSKLMAAWTERLDEAGLHDAMILPEFAVLPELNSAIDIEGRILLNIEARRMAVESTAPDDLLRAIVNSASQPLDVHGTLLAGRLGVDAIGEVDAEPLGTLKSFAEADLQLIDLRQGAFAARQSLTMPDFGKWRRPAIAASVAFAFWIGLLSLETRSLNVASGVLQAEAQSRFAAAFPGEGRVSNPASEVQARLASDVENALDFETAAASLYGAIVATEGASLRSLRYDEEFGQIRVTVDYGAYGDDIRLAERLSASGLIAELGDTRNAGNRITGEITLRARS